MNTCAMCRLYRDMYEGDCGSCPMRKAFIACGRRLCSPLECIDSNGRRIGNKNHHNHLEATKEFYYKVIARVRRMTVSELNECNGFRFMIDIDRSVGEKYGIKKEWE